MNKLPARTGWEWIKQGFDLFRRQPGSLAFLFLGYVTILFGIGIVPLLGGVLPMILIPVFAVAFMQAAATIERGERALPTLIMTGFRKPAFGSLFKLGLVYLAIAIVAVAMSALADGGTLWQLATGQLDPRSAEARKEAVGGAVLLALAVYLPVALAFSFAPVLVLWQRMAVGKAIFFSVFAVLRSLRAFVVLALSLFLMSILVSNLTVLIVGRQYAIIVMLPMLIILNLVMHCSFYAAYKQIFGTPQLDADIPAQT